MLLDEIFAYRGQVTPGGNPTNFMELVGAKAMFLSFYPPDPNTFREQYYYNTRQNKLFNKEKCTNPITNQSTYIWKLVSQ